MLTRMFTANAKKKDSSLPRADLARSAVPEINSATRLTLSSTLANVRFPSATSSALIFKVMSRRMSYDHIRLTFNFKKNPSNLKVLAQAVHARLQAFQVTLRVLDMNEARHARLCVQAPDIRAQVRQVSIMLR